MKIPDDILRDAYLVGAQMYQRPGYTYNPALPSAWGNDRALRKAFAHSAEILVKWALSHQKGKENRR